MTPPPDPAHDGHTPADLETAAAPPNGLLTAPSKPTPTHVRHFLASTLEILKPEIFQRRRGPARRPGPTAYLDGLRGWAAFCVALMHLFVYTHDWVELCYDAPLLDGTRNDSLLTLPIIRLPFTGGHFSVMLFFIISGYVVPRRLLVLLHENRRTDFLDAVQSAVIRRPVRLFMPVILSTLCLWIIWHVFAIHTPWPPHKDTFMQEAWSWYYDILKFVYVWRPDRLLFTYYNIHSWTIPVEYRGSMTLIIWLLMTSSLNPRSRVWITVGVIWYLVFAAPGAMYATFFAGMVTAELDLLANPTPDTEKLAPPSAPPSKSTTTTNNLLTSLTPGPRRLNLLLHLLLLVGLWLASIPSSDSMNKEAVLSTCPGWPTLSPLVPTTYEDGTPQTYRWFFLFFAAYFTLYSIKNIPWLRRLFETPPMLYLGRHSFSLYLVHGPLIGLFSERLFLLTGVKIPEGEKPQIPDPKADPLAPLPPPKTDPLAYLANRWINSSLWPFGGAEGWPKGFEPNFWVCVLITLPVFLYVAEVGTRIFDAPSVKLARWVDGRLRGGGRK
ncbi:hypothetical protein B0A50_05541 [Salinomyces thailandicus]|uniref:Acyltransferase 3 domain-containing protein n=1 Tax=Salinomyces thailandicus TaxID=706561 RepID=A0A4V5N430_9PEZI|nr:hypothetical protein B0A50_05541 [Salinomyces thailandica]